MPKTEIDYSSTIIYKITCKDPNVKDVYVGHTTNFVQRKHAHKQGCVNEKSSNYKCKLYETIRTNGGWNNWSMEIINFFKCRDHYEARIKEQEYFVSLNATLNSIEPLPKPKEIIPKNIVVESNKPDKSKNVKKIFCKQCNIECIKTEWTNHILSDSHNANLAKISAKYACSICAYNTCKKTDYNKHIATDKHIKTTNDIKNTKNDNKLSITGEKHFDCICGKQYKYDTGYYRHKKTCTYVPPPQQEVESIPEVIHSPEPNLMDIMQMLIKENQEIRNLVITQHNTIVEQNKTLTELVKNQQSSTNNSHNNNNKQAINDVLI